MTNNDEFKDDIVIDDVGDEENHNDVGLDGDVEWQLGDGRDSTSSPSASMRRSSRLSISLYGPETSRRSGRPNLLDELVQSRRQASENIEVLLADIADEVEMDMADDDQRNAATAAKALSSDQETKKHNADDGMQTQQQHKSDERSEDDAEGPTGNGQQTDGLSGLLDPQCFYQDAREIGATSEELHFPSLEERQHMWQRISSVPRDRSKLVQVNVENLSYHVPVLRDAPGKETVFNQSILYYTYEFFRRLQNLIFQPAQDSDDDDGNRSYHVDEISDLFVPYKKKTVLHNISLAFRPGKTYLVLGPPNAGRTTLLRAIAGRLPHHVRRSTGKPYKVSPHMTGKIAYNGITATDRVQTNSQKHLCVSSVVSFVDQRDVHAPYLTVRETFAFANACRSATGKKLDEAAAGENLTIDGLGLAQAQDTFVGNSNVRGVSGGQRRRVTLGEMMQGDPVSPVACADEISTGLDAAVTFDICQSIVNYSKLVGTTRIVSLLQPGPETFSLFDEVVLLSEGFLIYAGPVEDVVKYFETLGYSLPATMDVADFLQSVTTVDGALLFNPESSEYQDHLTPYQFSEAFLKSEHANRIQQLQQKSRFRWKDDDGKIDVPEEFQAEYRHSWMKSFTLNFRRHLLLWWRDKGFIYGKIFENVGMAAATGGILFGRAQIKSAIENFGVTGAWNPEISDELQTLQEGVFSSIFMTCLHILLGTTTSTPDDIDERPIHYKQADGGFYHTSAFVFARLLATLPQRSIEIVAFGIPVYFMVGLDTSGRSFFLFLLVLLCYTFSLKILYGIIAQIFPNKQNVLGFGTFLVLLFSLFSGYIVYPNVIPEYFIWLYWCNPMAWAFQAMAITEFSSDKYNPYRDLFELAPALRSRGFHTGPEWIGYAAVFFVLYSFVWATVLSLVLKKVRIEPKRPGIGSKSIVKENEPTPNFNLPFTPVDLTFEDLVYEVKASTGNETLRLLNGVCGVLRPGRMCALMGSSGAGKTTLMDVVSLRKTSGTISGEVRMNGFSQDRVSFLRSSGYVEQFDVQQAELTVRETVVFSARLRLSRDNPVVASDEGRRKYVDFVLQMMELTDIQYVQVGSYEEGGLSFEQRKRLAIAVELAASPSIIFLDEPTSGLDSRGALVIMRAMKRIADTGRTICATIHQPSAAVFEMFDDLLLMKRGGEVVFFGELGKESSKLVEYFENRGATPIKYGENPAAWMLRAYTKHGDDTDWKTLFEQSEQYREMKRQLTEIKQSSDKSKEIKYDSVFATSGHTQQSLMIRRIFHIMRRAPSYNLTRISIAVLYAAILGTVFLRTKNPGAVFYQNDVDGILSTIFIGLIIIGVVSVSMAVPVMKQIRDVFYKHRASGMLSHNSVTVAVSIGELPYIATMSIIFSTIFYSLIGLFGTIGRWLWFFLFFSLNIATYTYFGQAFMCLVRDTTTAGALVGALIGFNVFFSGLVVRPQYFVGPFLVGFWTAPGRYAYEAIIVTQFKDLDYKVIAEPLSPYYFDLNCTNPNEECSGTMESYVDFFFGGVFQEDHIYICLGVLLFCLVLARLFLWFSLWKFNYVNT